MQKGEFSSAVLLSIFKRKGGEGIYTKITREGNNDFVNLKQFPLLVEGETPLVCYSKSIDNWVLLTSKRILWNECEFNGFICLNELRKVDIAIQEEMKRGVFSKEKFTILKINDNVGVSYLLNIEAGLPFIGFFQVLHYVATRNGSM